MNFFLVPSLQTPVLWFTFIIGLAVGSFLNVVGLRFLKDESIVTPPSHCPYCNTPLKPQDNIPLMSYLLLGGKCRYCKASISIQYPLVELLTGLLFVFVVWSYGVSLQSLFLLFLIANLIVITITDMRESYIFQINSLSLIPAGLIYNFFNLGQIPTGNTEWMSLQVPNIFISALLGILVAVIFFEGMILLSKMAFDTDGFGHGDTHLMMGVGAYLGWELGLLSLGLGFILQALFAIPILVWQWFQKKEYLTIMMGALAMVFGFLPIPLLNMEIDFGTKQWIILGCIALTLIALVFFLKQVKKSQSYTYMPLGPALVLGSLISLFYGPAIIQGYIQLMHR